MDDVTIERARRRDRDAQAALLRRLQDPWFRFCRSLLHDDELARDATQETALRFLKLLPTFKGNSSVQTWSMGIALNVAREMRRKQSSAGSMRLVQDDEALDGIASNDTSDVTPVHHASRSEQSQLLKDAMNELSDRQREALLLRFFEDMSVEDTANAMQCAEGTVKATVHQALRALKTKLKQLT